jgi:hypothetical protein
MDQLLGIVVGLLGGIVWEKLGTVSWHGFSSLVPSLIIKFGGQTIHLHHWLIYFFMLITVVCLAWKTERLNHPAILFLISFLMGTIFYNFWRFPDWFKFFS